MARVVVLAWLWCMVGAEDYSGVGVGMPQYGADADYAAGSLAAPAAALSDDYRGHSPDAPAPLDYKYEEESQGNTEKHVKEIIETETWKKKPARKQRGLRHRDDPLDDSEEPLRQHESSRRQPWARAGRRGDKARAGDEGKRGRSRRRELEDDARARPFDYDHSGYRDDKNLILDEDIDTYSRRKTTERIIRRKPRDRLFANPLIKSQSESESDDMIPDRKMKPESGMEYEDLQMGQRRRPLVGGLEGGGLVPEPSARYRTPADKPALDSDQDESMRPLGKSGEYNEYAYYDEMKRLSDIKTKLPLLLRRTTTRSAPGAAAGSTNDLMAMLWTAAARRAGGGAQRAPAQNALPDPPVRLDHPDTSHSPYTTPRSTTTTEIPSIESTPELSIAEKSRLSILKKAQKKESVKGDPTKKPPVLLQVTSKLPTIVMVEPPTSSDPWMRARSVTHDNPEKLERVKQLMRHKLVAGAKSIQDLTDNWDDMVCDYIDVSLLDATAGTTSSRATTLHFIILILIFVLR